MSVEAWLEAQVSAHAIPGAAWMVTRGGRQVSAGAVGWSSLVPSRRRAHPDTVYDLASLTKPLATAALAVLLSREGLINLDDPLSEHLNELQGSPWQLTTLLDVLTHSARLPAWEPLYLESEDLPGYLHQIAALALLPDDAVVYSDLGYILAGAMLQRAAGVSLATLFKRHIARPLSGRLSGGGLPVRYLPPQSWHGRLAPTEAGDHIEQAMVAERRSEAAVSAYKGWRNGIVRGEVHDRNAAVLGGVAGHAGLFGSAAGVALLAAQFLPGSVLFDMNELALFVTPRTPPQGELRSIGFQIPTGQDAVTAGAMSARAFGHTGFTGTSLFIDPEEALVCVLLTNRVHPAQRPASMKDLRRGFHLEASRVAARAQEPSVPDSL